MSIVLYIILNHGITTYGHERKKKEFDLKNKF